jgi:hypothetical protein
LIVFKKGGGTKSIGLAFRPEVYEELKRLYRKAKGEGAGRAEAGARAAEGSHEVIQRAVREARTHARPIEAERVDRLLEYEALVTLLGRACLEVYNDVSVDPAHLVGKGPERGPG